MSERRTERIMDASTLEEALDRMAREILASNRGVENLGLVGIRTRGVPLARRLAAKIQEQVGEAVPVGILDINLYRDDLSTMADHPVLRKTEIPFDVDRSNIVLVDDVLFTGRTIRAALEGLMDLGRPNWIQLFVLVDRGHREVPIRPDYVGKNLPTSRTEQVEVHLEETDGQDEVLLLSERAESDTESSS